MDAFTCITESGINIDIPHENKQEDGCRHESPSVSRRQHTQHGKHWKEQEILS